MRRARGRHSIIARPAFQGQMRRSTATRLLIHHHLKRRKDNYSLSKMKNMQCIKGNVGIQIFTIYLLYYLLESRQVSPKARYLFHRHHAMTTGLDLCARLEEDPVPCMFWSTHNNAAAHAGAPPQLTPSDRFATARECTQLIPTKPADS